jgi:hypothetical protein
VHCSGMGSRLSASGLLEDRAGAALLGFLVTRTDERERDADGGAALHCSENDADVGLLTHGCKGETRAARLLCPVRHSFERTERTGLSEPRANAAQLSMHSIWMPALVALLLTHAAAKTTRSGDAHDQDASTGSSQVPSRMHRRKLTKNSKERTGHRRNKNQRKLDQSSIIRSQNLDR